MSKSFDTNIAATWITQDINHVNTVAENTSQAEKKEEAAETKKTVKKETTTAKKTKTTEERVGLKIQGSEKKTHQTSILLKESIFVKLESISKKNNISINNCINQILEQVLV